MNPSSSDLEYLYRNEIWIITSKDGLPKYRKHVIIRQNSKYRRNNGLYIRVYGGINFMYTRVIKKRIDRLKNLVTGGVEKYDESKMFVFMRGVKKGKY